MGKVYSNDEYQQQAEQAVKETASIPDFAYHGELPIGETWAFTFSRHRDSETMDISNYEVIKKDMRKQFPQSCAEVHCSHWAVGWIDHLAVEMLDSEGKVTEAGSAVLDWKAALESSPVADDADFSRREYENQHEAIMSEGYSEEQAQKVWQYLWDNNQEAFRGDDVCCNAIADAAFELGFKYTDEDCLGALQYQDINTDASGKELVGYVSELMRAFDLDSIEELEELELSDSDREAIIDELRDMGNVWTSNEFYRHYTPSTAEQLSLF